MFDLDPQKLVALGFIAVVVLGPNRLPQAARTMGRLLGQLRSLSASVQKGVGEALGEDGKMFTDAVRDVRALDVPGEVRRSFTSTIVPPSPAPLTTQLEGGADRPGRPFEEAPDHTRSAPDDPAFN
jgi:sec-independent protein translocase protein TatB